VDLPVSLDLEAAAVADDALNGLVAALATRDVEQLMPLFTEKASLFGSEDAEVAIGSSSIRSFFEDLCAQPLTYSWVWEVTAAGRDADVVWFVAPGLARLAGDDGTTSEIDPYRLSGVLRRIGPRWTFELFNGSEPTTPD
jgi:ketosteroid isomerase-like protein